ncbi:hypothetical protein [uncultured Rikenella sp.]|nr:hypothetical protein [uncultured Rikenella sp.]
MWNIGNGAYHWNAESHLIHAVHLHFTAQELLPHNSTYRATGFQLRCLSE